MSGGKRASFISQTFAVRTEFYVDGAYFKLLTSAAGSQVELYLQGQPILVAPAAKAGFYQRTDFDRVVITPSVNQLVEFLAAPDQGGSDAFTANSVITSPLDADNADAAAALGANGLVAVAARLKAFNGATFDRLRSTDDGAGAGALRVSRFGDEIAKANGAFIGCVQPGPVAAAQSQAQIINPVGSGILVYVDRIDYSDGNGASQCIVSLSNVALATDQGTWPSKNLGGAASKAHLRTATSGAGAPVTVVQRVNTPLNQNIALMYDPPLRLVEGQSVVITDGTVNELINVTFQWREKAA